MSKNSIFLGEVYFSGRCHFLGGEAILLSGEKNSSFPGEKLFSEEKPFFRGEAIFWGEAIFGEKQLFWGESIFGEKLFPGEKPFWFMVFLLSMSCEDLDIFFG